MQKIDINCDMGESTSLWNYCPDDDIAILPFITSANIACGFHAGDAGTMHELVEAALLAGVAIGAHPGFDDKPNFGRTSILMSPVKIYDLVLYQVGALDAFVRIHGGRFHHVKPHGALYNMAAADPVIAMAICRAVKEYNPDLILYGLSGSELMRAAAEIGLPACAEVFADRTYQDNGQLTPRSMPGALIEDVEASIRQVIQMASFGKVSTVNKKNISVQADTVCVHADGTHALAFAKNIHQALQEKGIEIKPV